MNIGRQKVQIKIIKNDDAETYRISFGACGVFKRWSRMTLEAAKQQAADLAEEVRKQQTGRPVISFE
jgi:hypothetical protein